MEAHGRQSGDMLVVDVVGPDKMVLGPETYGDAYVQGIIDQEAMEIDLDELYICLVWSLLPLTPENWRGKVSQTT